ncbi:PEGA domain-containing protein [Sorangium sp. So ce204]|uniref:PEGA domain-containing protein n=1 Tax=Sorangium sp. So ce204 TaxID=3133288 RepID=UPI003F645CD4
MRKLTMHVTGAAICVLSACALAPATALAQPAPPAAAVSRDDEGRGDNARATQLYREGNEAFKQKRWADAELLYLKAWALVRTFDVAANLGEVQIQLNKARSAATFLAFALRTAPPSTKPEQIARIRHFLDEAKAQVGTLRVRVKNAADAEVLVDGERVPEDAAKHEVYVEPGERTLVIRRAGYEDETLKVVAAPGITETVMPELKPKAAEAALAGAAGQGPAGAKAPEVGGATGAAATGEAKTKAPAVGMRAGTGAEEPRSWVPVIALGVASAVGLTVGVTTTVLSTNARASADKDEEALRYANGQCIEPPSDLTQHCRELRHEAKRAEGFGTASVVSYAASGALAIAAAAYALWPRRPPSASHGLRVLPRTHAGGGGVLVVGAW